MAKTSRVSAHNRPDQFDCLTLVIVSPAIVWQLTTVARQALKNVNKTNSWFFGKFFTTGTQVDVPWPCSISSAVSLFRYIGGSGGNCCLSIWSTARCKVDADSDLYRNGIRAKIGRTWWRLHVRCNRPAKWNSWPAPSWQMQTQLHWDNGRIVVNMNKRYAFWSLENVHKRTHQADPSPKFHWPISFYDYSAAKWR